MNKSLLFISLFISFASIGQKKITAISDKYYNESGVLQFLDSTAYNYTTWQGSINELKPKLKFDGDIVSFSLDEVLVHCNSESRYSGSPTPINLDYTSTNTFTNGLVTERNTPGLFRALYEYTSAGKVKSSTLQIDNSGTWQTQDSTTYTYDSFGNELTMKRYDFTTSVAVLNQFDSASYISGSDKLTKYKSYYYDFSSSTLVLDYQTLITYAGNNVQFVDLYYNNGSGVLEWTIRLNYNYTGSNCTGFVAYDVVNNAPTTNVFASGAFTYTASNQPYEYILTFGGNQEDKVAFDYYADGFLKNKIYYSSNSSNALYISEIQTYYFQNTAGLENLIDPSISIYPNPTKDFLTINTTSKIENIQIFDLNGRLFIEQNSNTLDIQHLPSGMYVVKGKTDGGTFSKKIIKE